MSKSNVLFKTPYGERERHFAPTGTGFENEYGYEVDNYGRKILVKTGEKNLYEEIQMALEETKIENILNRAMAGDMSGFAANGTYMDCTQLPNNLIDARKAMQNLENVWGTVPNEIKAKYNYSVEEFIGASGSDSWLRDMGLLDEGAKAPEMKKVDEGKTPDTVQEFGQVADKGVTANE